MARSPLIIERPQASLIRGNQLPQASGSGVPVPDIMSAVNRLVGSMKEKQDRNKRLADQLAGQRDAASVTGKDENGNYVQPPNVDYAKSPEYNAAFINTSEQNTRATILSDFSGELNGIMQDPAADSATKIARMEANLEGRLKSLPEGIRGDALQIGRAEIEQRKNTLASQDISRAREAHLTGIQTRITDTTNEAVSAAGSGNREAEAAAQAKTFDAVDELVDLGVVTPETAESMKLSTGRFVKAMGSQQRIATHVFNSDIDPAQLEQFAQVLDAGGDMDLVAEEGYVPSGFKAEDDRLAKPATRTVFNTNELRDGFNDPKTTQAVSAQLKELANFRAGQLRDYDKGQLLFNTLNSLGPYQSLPTPLRDDFNKLSDRMIQAGAHTTPEGMQQMVTMINAAKVVPTSFLDVVTNAAMSDNLGDAQQMLEVWHAIGASPNGQEVMKDVPVAKRAYLDAAAAAFRLVGSKGENADRQAEEWKRYQERTRDPDNNVGRSIGNFNTAARADGNVKGSFAVSLNDAFRSTYGGSMPPEFEREARETFHILTVLNPKAEPAATFDETIKRMTDRYESSPIYEDGFVRGKKLTDPDAYQPASRNGGTFMPGMENNRWAQEYTSGVIMDLLDDSALVMNGSDMDDLQRVLGESAGQPLGEGLMLRSTGDSPDMPTFNVILQTEDGGRVPLMVKDKAGRPVPLVIDPHLVRGHLDAKFRNSEMIEQTRELQEEQRRSEVLRDFNKAVPNHLGWKLGTTAIGTALPRELFDRYFLPAQPTELYKQNEAERGKALERLQERLNNSVPQLPSDTPIGPTQNLAPQVLGFRQSGVGVTQAAVAAIDRIVPDGTNGQFMMNVAAVESDYGRAGSTFRPSGDRGIFQINDGDQGAFLEVKRRAAIPGNSMNVAAEKIKAAYGIDVANASRQDLDIPLYSAAFARLYMLADSRQITSDVATQAAIWKGHYNTYEGAGTEDGFIAKADKFLMPAKAQAALPPAGGMTPGAIIDMNGKENPANFLAIQPHAQAQALRLSSAFGKELRVTPHGGKQPDRRKSTSQHHRGTALDVYVEDYSDEDKQRLIATAVAQGYRGIGGYAAGDGKGTLHFDLRRGGNGPGGIAAWWRKRPGVDGNWAEGPAWFVNGVKQGLEMRKNGAGKV